VINELRHGLYDLADVAGFVVRRNDCSDSMSVVHLCGTALVVRDQEQQQLSATPMFMRLPSPFLLKPVRVFGLA